MTKLAIMSDLHIDLNHFGFFEKQTLKQVLRNQNVSHLHLAGDISNHFYTDSLPFIQELQKECQVTYNLGNHDMLDLQEKEIQDLDFHLHSIGKKQLLAFHGWYDYSFSNQNKSDISKLKQTFWFDRRLKRQKNDLQTTENSLTRLDKTLTSLDSNHLIVAMHFVPHYNFIMTHERFKPFNAFLGSQKFHELFKKHKVKDVVFGHAHRSYGTTIIDGISYHSRPLGYLREWNLTIDFVSQNPQYNPSKSWNLSKRYNAVKDLSVYQNYKKQNLAKEFYHAMTLFDL
ncbi:metallophosphoesterase [Streptococcus macacae]|uniref:Phosphoesterase n=1 Tax=Streptococcus macacae NCTC 11558 TaxID=764298 RepID=G5JYQ8_9STRE|nr:metallophosphoesterase [Streptococcus macacae]EHJ51731.1 putative phosphoesterase [Streptococcus macacae NCTC 11558]SUN78168.1 putative phosphoesterase [Streptococcus macacae NCTC 11558]